MNLTATVRNSVISTFLAAVVLSLFSAYNIQAAGLFSKRVSHTPNEEDKYWTEFNRAQAAYLKAQRAMVHAQDAYTAYCKTEDKLLGVRLDTNTLACIVRPTSAPVQPQQQQGQGAAQPQQPSVQQPTAPPKQ